MAMQARKAAASHQPPIKSAPAPKSTSATSRVAKQSSVAASTAAHAKMPDPVKKPEGVSMSQRIARQGTVCRQDSARVSKIAPPPAEQVKPSMSAADRIQKQAVVASAQKHGNTKVEVNDDFLKKLRAEYAVYVKNLMAELEKSGPLYFVPENKEPEKVEPAVVDNVNGVSTAEGEMVMVAEPSEPVPGMPFQATPVITTPEAKRSARKSRKKAAVQEESASAE